MDERSLSADYKQFEVFVSDLFIKMGYENVRTDIVYSRAGTHYEIDIQFDDGGGDTTVVEVKRYRYSSPPPPDLFVRALRRIRSLRSVANVRHTMLVMSCPLTEDLRMIANQHPQVDIWDAQKLFEEAYPFPHLLKRLETLLEVRASDVLQGSLKVEDRSQQIEEQSKGEDLALALKGISPGRPEAYAFEGKCIEALKYLFDRDLVGWHEQQETEDGLHRRDLVCRILPNSDVWNLMLTDLKSRYVIFEFKNYSEPLTQKEIVTTERYLYPSALRNFAIIISPQGCSQSAMRVIQGAMREYGKLILPLKVSEIASLLVGKDQGSDPNAFLFSRVDNFLMNLGR